MSDMVRAVTISETRSFDAETRSVSHLISTERLDRAGDIVSLSGWDLRSYKRNAVVLQNHSYRVEDVIGRGENVRIESDGLYATTTFAETPMAQVAYDLVRTGFAGAWSVGFAPRDAHTIDDGKEAKCESCLKAARAGAKGWGKHFTKHELLEYSLVAVPMNPDAVTYAVKRGLLPEEMVQRFALPDDQDETRDGAVTAVRLSEETAAAIQDLIRKIGRYNAIADLKARANQIRSQK